MYSIFNIIIIFDPIIYTSEKEKKLILLTCNLLIILNYIFNFINEFIFLLVNQK